MKPHKLHRDEFPDRLDHARKLRLKYQVATLRIDTGGGAAEQIRRHLARVCAMERHKAHIFLVGYRTRSLPYRLVEIGASLRHRAFISLVEGFNSVADNKKRNLTPGALIEGRVPLRFSVLC